MAKQHISPIPPEGGAPGGAAVMDPPPHATPKPAPSGTDGLPRVCDPLERAAAGQVRIKVAIRNYDPQETRYVLCAAGPDAEQQAKDCAAKANGLKAHMDRLKARGVENPEPPAWVLTVLPD